MDKKITFLDWGDGTRIEVQKPDLSNLGAVMCPPACFPADGDQKMTAPFEKKVNVSKITLLRND